MNRLEVRITHARDCLARRVRIDNDAPLPVSLDLVAFEQTLDNTPLEHFAFQEAQARAHASGRLTTDEAQIIYMALGTGSSRNGWSARTDLATKLIVTEVMTELLSHR